MSIVDKLLCDNLKALKPYESARRLFSGGQDWLNANESPFANAYDIDHSRFNRYPDCQPASLIKGYAEYAGVRYDQVICTRGADEGIELLIRTFCTPGKDAILITPPTYGMYAISAETCNIGIEKAPLCEDFSLDVDAMLKWVGKVNVVFVCSPNNPTGTRIAPQQLTAILEGFADSALVVVDEAYIEFDEQFSTAPMLAQYDNLVILRTLSKAYALAGLRCGFTLASSDIIQALLKVIAPYPVPEPVAQIACQALSEQGVAQMRSQVSELNQQKAWLKSSLDKFPSITLVGDDNANFILFRCEQRMELMAYLVEQGMLIRDQSKQYNLHDCLRVTVGNDEQNQRFVALLTTFFQQQGISA
ncbi:histidinol-phosphate transaminase [Aestuariibacter salexigens]|uniref:histidinol-phosphate transaminase n=1 Tax=Aestuariibacter salexigens TaxID=226010 RepID=UPI00041242B4|nr:histidinol-phosphate transaminase [Aestuariibacter salexigens]